MLMMESVHVKWTKFKYGPSSTSFNFDAITKGHEFKFKIDICKLPQSKVVQSGQ